LECRRILQFTAVSRRSRQAGQTRRSFRMALATHGSCHPRSCGLRWRAARTQSAMEGQWNHGEIRRILRQIPASAHAAQ
jgi:hypothetical protein